MLTKRKIKFALVLNGASVRNIEDLKANFDGIKIVDYYENGDLQKWLEQRNYYDICQKVKDIKAKDPTERLVALHEIFEIPLEDKNVGELEETIKRRKRLEKIKEYTTDEKILEDINSVVFTQEELDERLSKVHISKSYKGTQAIHSCKVYLIGDTFSVSDKNKNITYIGINHPKIYLHAEKQFDGQNQNIEFKNVELTSVDNLQLRIMNKESIKIDEQRLSVGLDPEKLELKKTINIYDNIQRIHYYKDDWILIVTRKKFMDYDRKEKFREFYLYNLDNRKIIELNYTGEYWTKSEFVYHDLFIYYRDWKIWVVDLKENKLIVSFSTSVNHHRNSMDEPDYIFIEDKKIYAIKGVVISDDYYYGQLNCYDMGGRLLNYDYDANEKPLNISHYQRYKSLANKVAKIKAKWKMGRMKFFKDRIIGIGMKYVNVNDYGFTTQSESNSPKITIFDYETLKIIKTFETKNSIFDIEICDEHLLATDSERQLIVIDLQKLCITKTIKLTNKYYSQLKLFNNQLYALGDNYIDIFE